MEQEKKCHLVDLGDYPFPPPFCEKHRKEEEDEDVIECTCCPQCCTCGG